MVRVVGGLHLLVTILIRRNEVGGECTRSRPSALRSIKVDAFGVSQLALAAIVGAFASQTEYVDLAMEIAAPPGESNDQVNELIQESAGNTTSSQQPD